ncbi:VWA domain-containing protein [Paraurantiacibacter namhicola]|uniref:VWFA domain-containing protein n=1 Tax=Paraurantiacibacter namhicola TaxID=645517 RepID=A0A1C7D9R2_9SPHN|nr:VWA domain-containing protein [Paraurantiacibacter namhicola]ANU08043.1 hypothetical protein A6F65_01746 [Paraurantiacibacter namhicola]
MARTSSSLQLFSRLARDNAGNTLVIIAGALLPLLALVGGGVDASRGYMAQARLQQACDAGVLAARKQLGSNTPNSMPGEVKNRGKRFFDVNFPDKIYGTTGRKFDMTMESDFSISGVADVVVPTTVMNIFGYKEMPLKVECAARLNFTNLDMMMVIDVTGSMRHTNAGDSMSRIDSVRSVIKDFYNQMETSKQSGVRTRYGFVPYATNVNVGPLLDPDWVVDDWNYSQRASAVDPAMLSITYTSTTWTPISGDRNEYYSQGTSCPADAHTYDWSEETVVGTTTTQTRTANGSRFECSSSDGGTYLIKEIRYSNYVSEKKTQQKIGLKRTWRYRDYNIDVSKIKKGKKLHTTAFDRFFMGTPQEVKSGTGWYEGCIEERETYEITDYTSVDLNRAKDLDIDLVPNSDASRWKPAISSFGFVRGLNWDGTGAPSKPLVDSDENFVNATWVGGWFGDGRWVSTSACPAAAKKLSPMTANELDTYLGTLLPGGKTYHDTGMIWGGRLLSKDGLFASENADVNGVPTSRHLIFLTDGQTEPLDVAYSAYGVEAVHHRRWNPSSTLTLAQTVEERFKFACNEIKKRNITIWVVAFGTNLNASMTECAGPGRYFEASNSSELSTAFNSILKSMGDLRISK